MDCPRLLLWARRILLLVAACAAGGGFDDHGGRIGSAAAESTTGGEIPYRIVDSAGGTALHAAAAVGNHALTGYGLALHVVDVGDPEHPTVVGTLRLPGPALQIAVQGDEAYVAAGPGGLVVVDLSQPSAPRAVQRGSFSGPVNGVDVAGDWSAVSVGNSLAIVETSTGTEIGRTQLTGDGAEVAIRGTHVYAVVSPGPKVNGLRSDGGLDVVDASRPDAPQLTSSVALQGRAKVVTLGERLAFVGTRDSECFYCAQTGTIDVIDVGESESALLGRISVAGGITDLEYRDDWLSVSTTAGFQIIDVRNPSEPVNVVTLSRIRGVGGLATSDRWTLLNGTQMQVVRTPANGTPSVVGRLDVVGTGVIRDGLAYLAAGERLDVADVSEAASPIVIGAANLPSSAFRIDVVGDTVYALGPSRLAIVDVSDPRSPVLEAAATLPILAGDMAVSGSTAIFVSADSLALVNLQTSPLTVTTLVELKGARSVSADGSTALVAAGPTIHVFDISESLPEPVGSLVLPDDVQDVGQDGSLAAAVSDGQIYLIDVGNPDAPRVLGTSLSHPLDYLSRVELTDGLAVASGPSLVVVVDVSDPRSPMVLQRLREGPGPLNAAGSQRAILGQQVVDLASQPIPEIPGMALPPDRWRPGNLAVSGSRLALTDENYDLRLFGIGAGLFSEPDTAWHGRATSVELQRERLYVGHRFGDLRVMDLLPDGQIKIRGGIEIGRGVGDMRVTGDRLFMGFGDNDEFGLRIYHVGNPDEPRLLGQVGPFYGLAGGLRIRAESAFLASSQGVLVVDVADAETPTVRSRIGGGFPVDVELLGSTAYVSTRSGVALVDIADLDAPRVIGTRLETQGGGRLALGAGRLYVAANDASIPAGPGASSTDGVWVFDVTDPRAPTQLGRISLGPGSTMGDLEVLGSTLYVGGGDAGVAMIALDAPFAPVRGTVDLYLPSAISLGR